MGCGSFGAGCLDALCPEPADFEVARVKGQGKKQRGTLRLSADGMLWQPASGQDEVDVAWEQATKTAKGENGMLKLWYGDSTITFEFGPDGSIRERAVALIGCWAPSVAPKRAKPGSGGSRPGSRATPVSRPGSRGLPGSRRHGGGLRGRSP